MPTRSVIEKSRSTLPPKKSSASTGQQRGAGGRERAGDRLAHRQVDQVGVVAVADAAQVLADAVGDDDRVVERVADHEEHRGQHRDRELGVDRVEHAERQADVVGGGDDDGDRDRPVRPEAPGDVHQDQPERDQHRQHGAAPQVGADRGTDELGRQRLAADGVRELPREGLGVGPVGGHAHPHRDQVAVDRGVVDLDDRGAVGRDRIERRRVERRAHVGDASSLRARSGARSCRR